MNILITGAGRGLGYELTSAALARGHTVVAGVRNPNEANVKLTVLVEKYGERLSLVELDVTNESGIAAYAEHSSWLDADGYGRWRSAAGCAR
ncbi:SDR family NAD(P)-dependent oxidoreductase [Paenibacillus sp. KS-LC4]|uniref:SDR family NAD(P)-dependent oxidoreductase n=1 Tax=Paenibacillus sp. KS-LC4 TaxID=2979727 RepID=UPI0030D5B4C1